MNTDWRLPILPNHLANPIYPPATPTLTPGNWMDNSAHGDCHIQLVKQGLRIEAKFDEGILIPGEPVNAVLPNGQTYQGHMEEGKAYGKGTFNDSENQIMFEGNWQSGVPHGQGAMTIGQQIKVEGSPMFIDI